MKYYRIFLVLVLGILIGSRSALALDVGVDVDKGRRIERDKTISTRNSQEQRQSSGTKKSETTSTGTDQNDQETIKQASRLQATSSLDISIPLGNIFLPGLAMLEQSSPILKAKILSNPRQPADFGLSAEIQPGVIDSIKADLLSKAAASNGTVTSVGGDNARLRAYRDSLALYGVIVAQAYLNLSSDLAALNAGVTRDKDGNIQIHNLGYSDLLTLADGALLRAVDKISDKRLCRLYQTVENDKTPCRFAGSTTEIQCGSATITVSGKPTLTALGETIFSSTNFAGFSGNYKISSGWSYDQALEQLKSTSKYSRMAKEVSKYADNLESKGRVRDAVLVKKMAWHQAKSGKTSLSLGKLIPGF